MGSRVGFAARCVLVMTFITMACAQMGMPGMGGGKKDTKVPAVKSDVKFIRCGVCEEMAKTLHRDVKEMRTAMKKNKQLPEHDIIEKIEKFCDPETKAGEWVNHLDMLEDGSKIKLVYHEKQAKCGVECRTIARACEEVIGDADTDLGEVLFKGDINRAKLRELMCSELSDACESTPPKVPKSRTPGAAFEEMSDEAIQMAEMMAGMKDIPGMPGMNMYSKDDLSDMMAGYGGDEDGGYGGYGEGDYGEGDYGEDDTQGAAESADEAAAKTGKSTGFDMTEKVFEAVDSAAEVVTEGIAKAATVATDTVGKVASMVSGMFSGGDEKKAAAQEL